ncbi:MAG: Smr/MutS family protein [Pyrinomonadaceae bacterium]
MVFYLPMWLPRPLRRLFTTNTQVSRDDSAPAELPDDATDEAEVDPFNPFMEPVRLEIRDVFDLHTIAPRDVKLAVEEYLLEARRAGFQVVRIIHGKGTGVQRDVVRGVLARTPFVRGWTDAPPEAGGWGATVAHLTQDGE